MQNFTVINGGQASLNNSEEILESRLLRDRYADRIDVLNKVKKLSMLPDDIHVTVEMAASYYEVSSKTTESLILDHKQELESDGLQVVSGSQLSFFKKECQIKSRAPSLTVIPRRAILRIGCYSGIAMSLKL